MPLALVTAAISVIGFVALLVVTTVFSRRADGLGPDHASAADSLDAAALGEIQRARRYGRPLTVIGFVADHRKQATAIAAELRAHARVNDIVGFLGSSTVVAVLPETEEGPSTAVVQRLAQGIDTAIASSVRVGVTSFPGDEVTWVGLRESLCERTRPLAHYDPSRSPELADDLTPRRISERTDGGGAQVTQPAHAVDPAA